MSLTHRYGGVLVLSGSNRDRATMCAGPTVVLMLLTLHAISAVEVSVDDRTVRVGATVSTELGAHAILEGAIEYLACSQGGKAYESVLMLDASPREIYDGLLRVGLAVGSPATYGAEDNRVAPHGPELTLMVEWADPTGTPVRMRAEDLIYNTNAERPMARTDWIFTGSRMMEDPETEEQVLQATLTANVISTHQSDPSVLLQNPLVAAMDETSYRVNEQTLPAPGSPLTLIFDASQPGARRVFVTGKVQGVGFRAFTQEQAALLGVIGYVRNLTDGRVEVLVEGRRAVLAEMMRRLETGPAAAEVRSVETEDLPSSGQHETFTIRY